MSGFVLKDIKTIKGNKHDFYKLEINGVCAFDEFENKIYSNKQHFSEFKTLVSYAELYANGNRLPEKKWGRST